MKVNDTWLETIDSETIIIISSLLISAFVFYRSFEFDFAASVFPQVVSGTLIILTMLLLLESKLPKPLQEIVSESVDLTEDLVSDEAEMIESEVSSNEDLDSDVEGTTTDDTISEKIHSREIFGVLISPLAFTTVLIVVYALLSYLIGMLYITPMFVVIYGYWFNISYKSITILAVLSTVIIFAFTWYLFLPLDEGYILRELGVV